MFTLRTLGRLGLTGPAGELLAGRHKDLALLAYIARHRPCALTRAELAALFWGERPEAAARHSLRQVLLRLKRAVAGCLDVQADRVSLAEGALELDVVAFEADVEADRLREAIARWEGEFLSDAEDVGGATYRTWVEGERERLRHRLASACERLVLEAQEAGSWPDALRFAERWVEAMPLDERASQRLVETLNLSGRLEEARARHAEFVARARRDLDVAPSPAFLELGRELAARASPERRPRPTPGSSALFTPDLVGRKGAFNQLTLAWTSARSGDARIVVVEGDEGIGKTRLCQEFLRAVAEGPSRVWVLQAQAREAERDVPWSSARELLGGLLEAPGLTAGSPGTLAALGELVPGIRERFPPRADATRWPLVDAIGHVLASIAAELPVIAFLDDAPAADAATQALVVGLAARLRQTRVLLLLSARPDELHSPSALAQLRNAYGVERILLHPLQATQIESLLASMLELVPSERHDLALRLHAASGGNPFYVIEVMAALLDEGHFALQPGGAWQLSPGLAGRPLPLPAGVRDALSRRLAQLSNPARRLVEAAAVLRQPAEPAVLREVGGIPFAELDPALDEVIARRLLRTTIQPPGRYEFSHELARRATYDLLPVPRREALQRAAVQALRTHGAKDRARFVATSRSGHLLRLAGLYGLASVAALGAARIVTMQFGLPDWVMSGAVALLVAGLPVTIVTGLIERRRALGPIGGGESLAAAGVGRWLTWRRVLAGGALAFGTVGLSAAVYMGMRVLGLGPAGTLVASGALKGRHPVLLGDFVNRTTDTTLGSTMTDAFRVDLAQSATVRLVDAQSIGQALMRMQRSPGTPLTPALARELALREGIRAFVTGEIAQVDKGYALSASVVAAADGQVLTAARVAAPGGAQLIAALDELSRKLRARIGESLKSIRATEPLERVTTGSLEALRKYSEASRAGDKGDYERAAALYRDATAIDTGFAMAYRGLSSMLANGGASRAAIAAAATKAFQRRDRLPEIEGYLATAWYYTRVEDDPQQVIGAYRSVLERDADNTVALNNLALALNQRRQWREAESLAVRATQLGRSWSYFSNAAFAQAGQGHYADARATLERFARTAPPGPGFLVQRAMLESAQGDYAGAEEDLRRLRLEQSASLLWQSRASLGLARLDEVQGRLRRAERDWADYMAASAQRGLAADYVTGSIAHALLNLRYRNRRLAAVKTVEAALARHPLSAISLPDRPYLALAAFYAEAGHPEVATRLLAEYERLAPAWVRRADGPARQAAAGAIALAEGRNGDGVRAYRAWADESLWPPEGLFELATAYERAHQADSALLAYEQMASTTHMFRLLSDAHALAHAVRRLSELYEARGERAKAREYCSRFIALWKDADPELQPLVVAARVALKRLSGATR